MINLGSSFRKLLLTVTFGLGFMASAQAAVYVGSWDPKFSTEVPVDQIGWSGTSVLTTQGTCSGANGSWVAIAGCGNGFSAVVTSATVNIYSMQDASINRDLVFAFDNPVTSAVTSVFLDAQGAIGGWTGGQSNTVKNVTLPPALNTFTNFSIYWDLTGPRMTFASADPFNSGLNTLGSGKDGDPYNLTFTVTAVPEASSLAMMVAGLGLVGFIGRNRKKRSTVATM